MTPGSSPGAPAKFKSHVNNRVQIVTVGSVGMYPRPVKASSRGFNSHPSPIFMVGIAQLVERRSVEPKAVGSCPTAHPKILKRDVMDKMKALKMKAEIANLRRIMDSLPPGTMKQALAKRAAELGKKVSPYEKILVS